MASTPDRLFTGFSHQTTVFFSELKANNNRDWFQANKDIFDKHVITPARSFVSDMGKKLRESISDQIVAQPAVNKSIFRIYRDTRFSLNKLPYKTHLGIYFWEGPGKKLENSGFYFHLEPPNLILGGGMYMIPKNLLGPYRQSVVDDQYGEELTAIIGELSESDGYTVGGKHYKRIPPGYDADHPNGELLLHNGLWAGYEEPFPEELFSENLIPYCLKIFQKMAPLHRWLVQMSYRYREQI